MKAVLEEKMQIELPNRCLAGVKELLQSKNTEAKPALTQREVMFEVEQKNAYLCAHWRDHIGSKDDGFGVKDFQGVIHRDPPDYLAAVGQDPTIYDKIDYKTDVAHKIKQHLEYRLERDLPERCLADPKAHEPVLNHARSRGMELGDW